MVVTNVAKFVVTGRRFEEHTYYRHSGRPGGLKSFTMEELYKKNPVEPLRRAVLGMMPKNKLKWQRMKRLRLFPGPEHAHEVNFQRSPSFHVDLPADEAMTPRFTPILPSGPD